MFRGDIPCRVYSGYVVCHDCALWGPLGVGRVRVYLLVLRKRNHRPRLWGLHGYPDSELQYIKHIKYTEDHQGMFVLKQIVLYRFNFIVIFIF